MKCPVCKTEIGFDVQSLDEAYYDCSHCSSSLLFRKGECEVLSEGAAKEEAPEAPHLDKGKGEGRGPASEAGSESFFQKESSEEKNIGDKDSPGATQDKNPGASVNGNKASLAAEEGIEEEEDFIPDETTQVPELSEVELKASAPEEESMEGDFAPDEAKQSERGPEVSSPAEKSLREDFAHREAEQSEKESQKLSPEEESFAPDEANQPEEEPKASSAIVNGGEGPSPSLEEDFVFEEELEESPVESQNKSSHAGEGSQKKEDFSEVAEFGNTQDESRKGLFLYDLTLSEINSLGLKERVLSTLQDESLNLSFGEEDIKEGRMRILKISPVQAYIIVTALMGLPLQISWSQHHIAED